MATLLSVNVGLPKDVAWAGRTVHTGIWKQPVNGPRVVRRLNVDGDGQGDLTGHGGEQRAVLVYQIDSYRYWQKHFGRNDFTYGQFGENFTVEGLPDDEVCIGDRYRIGEAEFEVTQPRVTCYRVGMRLGEPELPALLVAHGRPGFYLRVITEGLVAAGDEIVHTRTGPHALSVADADALLYLPHRDQARLRAAVDIPALSPGWQQSFRDLLATADAGAGTIEQPAWSVPGWPGFRPLRVARLVPESADVVSVYLTAQDDAPLPAPRAGQYLTLRVSKAADPPPVRNYSLSSGPEDATYRISVKRETHGVVSGYLYSALRPGETVDVAAPRGDFVLGDGSGPVLLVSAGVGVTPVIAMLRQLSASHSRRDVWWIYTARDAKHHPFAGEAHRLLRTLPRTHEHIFYTALATESVPAGITGGRLTPSALAGLGVPVDATAYVCGPARFMADMTAALVGLGFAPDRVRMELFGSRPAIQPGVVAGSSVRPHQPAGAPGDGPDVTFARSGLTVRWDERHRSILELADDCGVPTRFSCRTGVCHTCVTALVTGRVNYAPLPLEAPPAGSVLICCARPAGQVVLDL